MTIQKSLRKRNVFIEKYEKCPCQSIELEADIQRNFANATHSMLFTFAIYSLLFENNWWRRVYSENIINEACALHAKLTVMFMQIFLINYQLKCNEFELFNWMENFNPSWLAYILFSLPFFVKKGLTSIHRSSISFSWMKFKKNWI